MSSEAKSDTTPSKKLGLAGIMMAQKAKGAVNRMRSTRRRDEGGLMRLQGGTSWAGIPLRDMLLSLYNIRRARTAVEAVWFILFMALFSTVTYTLFAVHTAFQTNDALIDLFLDEEFTDANYKKNFFEIMTQEEMWTWLQGPLLNGAYPDSWYNGDPLAEDDEGYLLHSLRRIGGVQLRQLRVSNDSCKGYQSSAQYANKGFSCFPDFSPKSQSKQSFGPAEAGAGWTWSDGHHDLSGLYGYGPNYGSGGFVTVLSTNRSEAQGQLQNLFQNRWTDRQTRAVSVMFNAFSPDTGLLTVMRVLFELFPSGHLVKSFKIYSLRVILYETALDYFRAAAELLLFAGCLTYLMQEALQATVLGVKYLYEFGNVYEVMLQGILFGAIAYWASYMVYEQRREFTVDTTAFTDYYDMAERFIYVFTLLGVVGLFLVLKLFRFFGLSKQATALWQTLIRATPDLIAFGIGFCVLIGGFAFVATLLYGPTIESFHNMPSAFSSLLRFALGDFDYEELSRARPAVTGWFFALYIASIVLVGMNVLIAIVTMYFEEVNRALATNDPWKSGVPSLDQVLLQSLVGAYRSVRGLCISRTASQDSAIAAAALAASGGSSSVAAGGRTRASKYEQLLEQALDQAQEFHGEDLFACMDRLYKSSKENQYVPASELARLVNAPPTVASGRDSRLADKIIQEYHSTKDVLLVGEVPSANLDFYTPLPSEDFSKLLEEFPGCRYAGKLQRIAKEQPKAAELTKEVVERRRTEALANPEFFVFVDGSSGGFAFRLLQFRRDSMAVHSFDRYGKQRGKYPLRQLVQLVEVEEPGKTKLELVLSPAISLGAGFDDQPLSELVADTGDKKVVFDFVRGSQDRKHFVRILGANVSQSRGSNRRSRGSKAMLSAVTGAADWKHRGSQSARAALLATSHEAPDDASGGAGGAAAAVAADNDEAGFELQRIGEVVGACEAAGGAAPESEPVSSRFMRSSLPAQGTSGPSATVPVGHVNPLVSVSGSPREEGSRQ